jgi:hypothetical protein
MIAAARASSAGSTPSGGASGPAGSSPGGPPSLSSSPTARSTASSSKPGGPPSSSWGPSASLGGASRSVVERSTRPAIRSTMASEMPLISISSPRSRMGPTCSRRSTIRSARVFPKRGRLCSVSESAWFSLTLRSFSSMFATHPVRGQTAQIPERLPAPISLRGRAPRVGFVLRRRSGPDTAWHTTGTRAVRAGHCLAHHRHESSLMVRRLQRRRRPQRRRCPCSTSHPSTF